MKNKIFLLALILTGGLVAGGEYLGLTWMYNLAAIEFGLVGVIGGLRIVITGQARGAATGMHQWSRDSEFTQRYSGVGARLQGY